MTSEPYVAVIFTNQRTDHETDAYEQAAQEMADLATKQAGYRGIESVRGNDGVGITVSYWDSHEHAVAWKQHHDHLAVQRAGRDRWYAWYHVRVATVEREYSYDRGYASPHDDVAPG